MNGVKMTERQYERSQIDRTPICTEPKLQDTSMNGAKITGRQYERSQNDRTPI